jgi:hypothetical protein
MGREQYIQAARECPYLLTFFPAISMDMDFLPSLKYLSCLYHMLETNITNLVQRDIVQWYSYARYKSLNNIHTNTQTHKHTNTQTHKHTNTQTHKHTNTQTHKHTNTQTHSQLITITITSSQNHAQDHHDLNISDPQIKEPSIH